MTVPMSLWIAIRDFLSTGEHGRITTAIELKELKTASSPEEVEGYRRELVSLGYIIK